VGFGANGCAGCYCHPHATATIINLTFIDIVFVIFFFSFFS
jgi:hypothetical protein